MIWTRIVTLIFALHTVNLASAQCVSNASYQDTVKVTTTFQFKNPEFQANWIYYSLHPRLEGKWSYRKATSSELNGGGLTASFCIPVDELPQPNSKFKFFFGARMLEASLRPIEWQETAFVDSDGKKIREGKMPIINFSYQPDPDWLVVTDTKWVFTNKGSRRMELQLYNFGNSIHPTVYLGLEASRPPSAVCWDPGSTRYAEVPVFIRVEKGELKAASGDPQSPEPIARKAKLSLNNCSNSSFTLELGPTGPIAGKQTLRIRYSFEKSSSTRHTPLYPAPFDRWRTTLNIWGDRVFPQSVDVY